MSANKPFYMSPSLGRKTSAEIVSEARRSLRTVHTQRPFTPKDDQRRLLGQYPCRALESRPPSSFSLEARHFEESDSRPGSGKRLSPLEYRPQMPPLPGEEDGDHDSPELSPATPTPPTNPQQPRTGSAGRLRLLRANPARGRPLTRLPAHSKHNSDPSYEPGHSLRSNTQQDGTPDFWVCEKGDPSLSSCEKAVPLRLGTERASPRPTRNRSGSVPRTARGNGNYAATEAEETTAQNSRLSDLLQEIHSLAQAGAVDELCCTCERLRVALAEGAVLGRNSSMRSTLLRTLFKLVDVGSDKLSLQLANLALVLGISGNNLLNICKLIFRVSRDDGNDALFRSHPVTASLLVLLRHGDVCSDGEALLYCVGALKFLSGDAGLRRQLQAAGSVPTLLLLVRQLNDLHGQGGGFQVIWGHILLQLTATLRNLAELPECRPEFLTRPGLPELCEVLTLYAGDADVCTNVTRIFSKLSSYHDCCLALADTPSCYPTFSTLLRNHSTRLDLVVRILFTLGSLTAKSDAARRQTCGEGSDLLDALLPLFRTCHATGTTASEDVLAKLTRVLANAAMCPATGAALVDNAQCVHSLLDVLERSLSEGREEVVINTTVAINNLSFYESDGSVLRAQPLLLARCTSSRLDLDVEAALEHQHGCRAGSHVCPREHLTLSGSPGLHATSESSPVCSGSAGLEAAGPVLRQLRGAHQSLYGPEAESRPQGRGGRAEVAGLPAGLGAVGLADGQCSVPGAVELQRGRRRTRLRGASLPLAAAPPLPLPEQRPYAALDHERRCRTGSWHLLPEMLGKRIPSCGTAAAG
ncbi:armadillo repeat-containing protein 2 isoform X2 [Paramormyrops kingsleyae]|uniref:armadillo repeat-containing protein 2 isoform X2 n=1 Tax=Paramormyrops kingsleyae TaxID=1676925 RepID=UPI000CD64DB7|nr:armadillo repeat-containing protein 2 isoform X2 [Paramormyrops kingsleyae]